MVLLEIGACLIASFILNIDYWFSVQTIKSFIEARLWLICMYLQYYLIGAAVYGMACYYCCYPRQPKKNIVVRMSGGYEGQETKKRIMFIIAQPGDEVMFFGPTILDFIQKKYNVYLFCLSFGNGFDFERTRELVQSYRVLGIPSTNVTMMQFAYTRGNNDPIYIWNIKKLAWAILQQMNDKDIKQVYTFGLDGVSGHINHRSIFFACAHLCLEHKIRHSCTVHVLDSVMVTRKFSFFLDAAASFIFNFSGRHRFMINIRDTMKLRAAFCKHRSQMVWYRKLYMYFSRYMYINTYTKLDYDDLHVMLMSENISVAHALYQAQAESNDEENSLSDAFEDIFH